MLSNLHTHTTFCDGQSSAEEVVLSAIDKGFASIGFSGHYTTPFDMTYCIKDIDGYCREINRLKEKYKSKIQIYLGTEEDMFSPVPNRSDYEYIIGSCHYMNVNGVYYTIDSSRDHGRECFNAFNHDAIAYAKSYYETFCDYILKRKPDIVGHFDLLTKFDECEEERFLNKPKYWEIAEHYMKEVSKSDLIFEVNTGAISRGFRRSQYPHERLLHILKKENARITLSSDSHSADTIDCEFEQMRAMLRDIGFSYVYVLYDNKFEKDYIK